MLSARARGFVRVAPNRRHRGVASDLSVVRGRACTGIRYVVPFPLRAMIVWDDCDDRAALYDEEILRLVAINQVG